MSVVVHLVRHAQVASHSGDVSLTDVGVEQSHELGKRIAGWCRPHEQVRLVHSEARRAVDTASVAYRALVDTVSADVDVIAPQHQGALRSPDLFVAGALVDMGTDPQVIADQVPGTPLRGDEVVRLPFWRGWFTSDDPIGHWVAAVSPRGEDAAAVARRTLAWCASLRDVSGQDRRYVAVTHSPNLRACLLQWFGEDPGEPDYTKVLTIDMPDAADAAQVRWRGHQRSLLLPA